ncbi:MAG: flagellar biosynthesis anti-sigma factor FlgM [Clostridiaceae bacterium]|nr:flagellar biosynthesis anti-sigma factor FlgM [Clostridiaceae bacterium]
MGFNINKVDGISGVYKNQKVESRKDVPDAATIRGKKDELQISKEAMDFQLVIKAAKAAREVPDIREEVVAPIKEKLDNGTYEVDSRSIADKLLARRFNIKA